MDYMATFLSSMMSTGFILFLIIMLGYLFGGIKIKGVSFGTAGVLIAALLFGLLAHEFPYVTVGTKKIVLFLSEDTDGLAANAPLFSLIMNIGTMMFISAVGLTAGPKFFRSFNKKTAAYVLMGPVTIGTGFLITFCIIKLAGIDASLATGLFTGAFTSTPGFSSAKDAAPDVAAVTAGYGIAYLFGVVGKVLFVQLTPKVLKADMDEERKKFVAAGAVEVKPLKREVKAPDSLGFFAFALTCTLGAAIGSIQIPGLGTSLGTCGGCIIAGLIIGHFAHIGPLDLRVKKETIGFFRELGLVFFLAGAGVPGGQLFMDYVLPKLFVFGMIITLIPMIIGYIISRRVFKMSMLNGLGSVTGGMTSTPALGALIRTAGTDEVASAYAATYPAALILIVLAGKVLVLL